MKIAPDGLALAGGGRGRSGSRSTQEQHKEQRKEHMSLTGLWRVPAGARKGHVPASAFPGEVETGSPSGNATKQGPSLIHRFNETVNEASGRRRRWLGMPSAPPSRHASLRFFAAATFMVVQNGGADWSYLPGRKIGTLVVYKLSQH